MTEISHKDRDYVRSELVRLAEYLRKRYSLDIPKAWQLLREIFTASV